jgi:tRNA A-37 threonylcarbamoyl transferase component Bud32
VLDRAAAHPSGRQEVALASGDRDRLDHRRLASRIEDLTGWTPRRDVEITRDTSDAMGLHRGHVLDLGGRLYAVLGHTYESRFGISDQPKYWVLRTIELASGKDYIVKTVFHEEFTARIGPLRIRCYRSPQKESEVLELVRSDTRFMQGETVLDSEGNQVRILDFIPGPTLFQHVLDRDEPHEAYVHGEMQNLLYRLIESIEGIQLLHDHDLCHGDIRNDHIIIDRRTDRFRWIDFDLKQDFSDFDVWSIGNVLAYVVGQGITSFHQVLRSDRFPDAVKRSLTGDDASAFYDYRIINLRKLYPYIPSALNTVLMRFSVGTTRYYGSMLEVVEDLGDALESC